MLTDILLKGKGAWWFSTMLLHGNQTMVVGTFILSDLFLLFRKNQIPVTDMKISNSSLFGYLTFLCFGCINRSRILCNLIFVADLSSYVKYIHVSGSFCLLKNEIALVYGK